MRRQDLAALAIAELRLIGNRFADAANANKGRFCRLIALHSLKTEEEDRLAVQSGRAIAMAIPNSENTPEPTRGDPRIAETDFVLPQSAIQHCPKREDLGRSNFNRHDKLFRRYLFLAYGNDDAAASAQFLGLAEEAGKITQAMDPSVADIGMATTSRNLWCGWLFSHFIGLDWVRSTDFYDVIDYPFAASSHLSNLFVHIIVESGVLHLDNTVSALPTSDTPAKPAKPPRFNPHKDRNQWIYEQLFTDKQQKEILAELVTIATEKGWETFESASRISQIGRRHAIEYGLPMPPERRKRKGKQSL